MKSASMILLMATIASATAPARGAGPHLVDIRTASASSPCEPPANPYFEFQVDKPARFLPTVTQGIRPPADRLAPDASQLLVQFVVDTAGIPDARTFKTLKTPTRAIADSARTASSAWRYTPAKVNGCPVPQLVQTSLIGY